MLVVVTTVSALVHLYSWGYMAEDPHRPRFMAYLSLFTFAMLMLVTADNLVQMFFGWEGVGLCSYLLIGFWFRKKSAADAGKKAFVVNRIGDYAFVLGMLFLFARFGSLDFQRLASIVSAVPPEQGVFGAISIANNRLFILVLAVLAVVVLTLVMKATPLGRRIRAVVQNRNPAAVSGIPTGRIDRLTFFIGSGLAGIAGVALTLLGPIGPTMGTNVIIDAFLVVVVGGLGQLRGAVIAAFTLGILNSFIEFKTDASLAKVIVFVLIIAFLQFRPQGLAVQKTRSFA